MGVSFSRGVTSSPVLNYGEVLNAPAQYLGKIIALGDSLMAGNWEITSVGGSTVEPIHAAQRGFLNWLQALTGYGFSHRLQNISGTSPPGGDNFAVAGDDFRNVVTRIDDALLQNGDIYWFHFGTNDITSSRTAENILNSYRYCIDKCIAQGKKVWFNTIFPRNNDGGSDFTAPQNAIRLVVNAALLNMEAEYKGIVTVFNWDPLLMDATGKLISAYATDGIHLNSTGASLGALNILIPKLVPFYNQQKIRRNLPEDYNSTNVPQGNLITNSSFTGTAGVVGTGFTGSVPTSWTTARTDGTHVTTTVSIESLPNWNGDAANFVKFLLTSTAGGADNETHRINPTSTITTGVAIGEWYYAEVELIVDPTASGTNALRSVYAELRDNGTSGPVSRMFNVGYTNGGVKDFFPEGQHRLILRTFPIQARTATGLQLRLNADFDGTLTGTRAVYFGQSVIRPLSFVDRDGTRQKASTRTGTAASPYFIKPAQSGENFHNTGVAAENYYQLPIAIPGPEYGFYCNDADGIRAVAGADDIIQYGVTASVSGGFIHSSAAGSFLKLACLVSGRWTTQNLIGTWSDS
jgi:lysophospholipase L1-like esterase